MHTIITSKDTYRLNILGMGVEESFCVNRDRKMVG